MTFLVVLLLHILACTHAEPSTSDIEDDKIDVHQLQKLKAEMCSKKLDSCTFRAVADNNIVIFSDKILWKIDILEGLVMKVWNKTDLWPGLKGKVHYACSLDSENNHYIFFQDALVLAYAYSSETGQSELDSNSTLSPPLESILCRCIDRRSCYLFGVDMENKTNEIRCKFSPKGDVIECGAIEEEPKPSQRWRDVAETSNIFTFMWKNGTEYLAYADDTDLIYKVNGIEKRSTSLSSIFECPNSFSLTVILATTISVFFVLFIGIGLIILTKRSRKNPMKKHKHGHMHKESSLKESSLKEGSHKESLHKENSHIESSHQENSHIESSHQENSHQDTQISSQ